MLMDGMPPWPWLKGASRNSSTIPGGTTRISRKLPTTRGCWPPGCGHSIRLFVQRFTATAHTVTYAIVRHRQSKRLSVEFDCGKWVYLLADTRLSNKLKDSEPCTGCGTPDGRM